MIRQQFAFRIWHFPVVLGHGKRLFRDGALPAQSRLTEVHQNTMGAVLTVYERAGALRYGELEGNEERVLFD